MELTTPIFVIYIFYSFEVWYKELARIPGQLQMFCIEYESYQHNNSDVLIVLLSEVHSLKSKDFRSAELTLISSQVFSN